MKMNHPLRKAKWIWPENCPYMRNTHAEFHRDFAVPHVPQRAPFYITADQCYMLYVNGRYVGRGPARGLQATWAYDEYDLAPYLARGGNWLAIRVYNGGISTGGYRFEWHAGLLCAARWPGVELASGADWPSRVSPAYRADTMRVSGQLNFQEQVDARLDDQEWLRSVRPPRTWPGRSHARPFGVMPWHAVEPRGMANLGEEIVPYAKVCSAGKGRAAAGYEDTGNVVEVLRRELDCCHWERAAPRRPDPSALSVELPATGRGGFSALEIDLGRLGVGTLLVDAGGAAGGEIVDFHFAETAGPEGAAFLPQDPHLAMAARLRLRPGRTRHEFFHLMGHRYLTVVIRDSGQPIRLRLALRETLYPFDITGRFACGDPILDGIHRISVRTQRLCAMDGYVDTPWREQAQWCGDARVQARNTFHLTTDARLLVRGIRCIARQEVPNGLTYGHTPTVWHGCILPDFSLIWTLAIWDYWWQTGDVALFREQWPRIERLLSYFTGEGRGKNGLLRYDERYWLFLDWADLHKQGTPTLLNLWYLHALAKLSELAGAAKMSAALRQLRRLHGEQKRLVIARLWDLRKGMFRDGLTPGGRPVEQWSIHTQTLAILCGLKPNHWRLMIEKRLLPYLRGRRVAGAQPSSYWVTYVYSVMTAQGYGRDVVEHIRRKFAPMIPYGGTWETFDYRPGQWSTSHAWSAHPVHHLPGDAGRRAADRCCLATDLLRAGARPAGGRPSRDGGTDTARPHPVTVEAHGRRGSHQPLAAERCDGGGPVAGLAAARYDRPLPLDREAEVAHAIGPQDKPGHARVAGFYTANTVNTSAIFRLATLRPFLGVVRPRPW